MTQHLFGIAIRISDPAPKGQPGLAGSRFFAVQEFAYHVC
jgi:hypothetical protein